MLELKITGEAVTPHINTANIHYKVKYLITPNESEDNQ